MNMEDRQNILAAVTDPKFKSLLKLFENQKTTFLKIVAFGKAPEEMKKVYQGGAMVITAIATALEATALGVMDNEMNEQIKQRGLDVVGW